jgi:serine protease AprX
VLDDANGHGSHVAGVIAGNGAQSDGAHIGVAPEAELVDVQVADDQGMSSMSDVILGLQWILEHKAEYNIRVINLSLNSTVAESYHTNPLNAAVEILWFNGIVVVVSAGNNGTATLYPPANDPFVIVVGATDDKGTWSISDDVVASFSAYGVTADGFAKPDLVAPGRNIVSLLASDDSNFALSHPSNAVPGAGGISYFRMSGTSAAAPMVSGAVALLLQAHPHLTPDQVKYRLMATANKTWPGYDAAKAGAGYLNILAAVFSNTTESANTGLPVSQLLTTGSDPINSSVNWNSVNWNSVNWNSVNWNSVNWNSVNWNSVNWNSDYWEP